MLSEIDCFQRDKKRVVDEVEGKLWADAHGFIYFEVSALTGEGISEMFQVSMHRWKQLSRCKRKCLLM